MGIFACFHMVKIVIVEVFACITHRTNDVSASPRSSGCTKD